MTIQRMDHVGVVVDDLQAATAFFVELGMEIEGEAPVEGSWVDRVVGLDNVRVDIAMMRTPDGHHPRRRTRWRGGAIRGQLPALLRTRPEGIIVALAEQLS